MKRGRPSKPTCPTCRFKAQDARGLSAHMRNANHGKYGAAPANAHVARLEGGEPIQVVWPESTPQPVPRAVNGSGEPPQETPEYHLQCAMKSLLARKAELEKIIQQHAATEAELVAVCQTIAKLKEMRLPGFDLLELQPSIPVDSEAKTV